MNMAMTAKERAQKWREEKRASGEYNLWARQGMLRQLYKMTLEQYDELLKKQGGVCAICGDPPGDKSLAVDHDWNCCATTKTCGECVRGLLCFNCNTLLGKLERNGVSPLAIQSYLEG